MPEVAASDSSTGGESSTPRQSEQRYLRLLETMREGVWVIDRDAITTYANPRMAEMLGYSVGEMLGRHLCSFLDERGRETAQPHLLRCEQGVAERHDYELLRKDGGRVYATLEAAPLYDSRGQYDGAIAAVTDLSERRRLEQRILQAQKMETVGRLAGGVAHDFNNLLTAISAYGELVRQTLPEHAQAREDLEELAKTVDRASGLTRQLLAFSRRQVLEMRLLDVNELVSGVDKLLRRLIGEDIELVTILSESPALVRADPGQLEQVLVNLAVNGRDAMPGGGKLFIEIAALSVRKDAPRGSDDLGPGDYVVLTVRDTGAGMPAQVLAHIFEPFFTTKEPERGTGLGLATVFGIVKQHQGEVRVASEVGSGSAFRVYLPRAIEVTLGQQGSPQAELPRGSETVLLVEDEETVRRVGERILLRQGYGVLTADSGEEALSVFQGYSGSVDLLVADVVMPLMGGLELARRLRELRPDMKVLLVSGYSPDTENVANSLRSGIDLLPKPFTSRMLAAKVREVLDR